MIECMTWATAHEFGDALPDYHRLRYQMLIAREKWDVPHFDNMEYDQFDTPATVYLTYRDANGDVISGARMVPTTRPYMIQTLWPDLMGGRPLPKSIRLWEGSRWVVSGDLDKEARRATLAVVGAALQEFCLAHGIEGLLFQIAPNLLRHWQEREPGVYESFGREVLIDGETSTVGGVMHVSPEFLELQRRRAGITGPQIRYPKAPLPYQRVA
jgi:N-acyl-L-homoserine lactone synthetase